MAHALAEVDEDYEDSSDLEDEDELNQRIQKKSTDSPEQVDMGDLTRSQTEPHGDISDFNYKHKANKGKHVERKKKKNGKSSSHLSSKNGKKNGKHKNGSNKNGKHLNAASQLKKAKSMHSKLPKKHTYRQDDIDEMDVQSVESEDGGDIMDATITEDDVYMDMSITAEELYSKQNSQHSKTPDVDDKKKPKRSWTIGNMKESIMGAMSTKKRSPLSPGPKGAGNGYNGHGRKLDSPHSTSMGKNGYSPTSPDPDNLSHSLSQHSNGSQDDNYRKDSNNSRKSSGKGSVSTSLFQGAKGLFGRSGSSKDFTSKSGSLSRDDDEKQGGRTGSGSHKKAPSKSGLTSFTSKLRNIKNMGSSQKNIHASTTPTPSQEQNMETRKAEKKKKKSGKGSDQLKRKKDKAKNDIQPRKRSASQNKAPHPPPPRATGALKPKNKPQKRHSMKPEHRSRSQKPQSRQSTNTINSNKSKGGSSSANRYRKDRNKTEADIPYKAKPPQRNASYADVESKPKMKKGSKSERDEKKITI